MQVIITPLTEVATQHRPRLVVQVLNPFLHFTQLMQVKANRHVFPSSDLDFELNLIIGTVPGDVASPGKDLVNQ